MISNPRLQVVEGFKSRVISTGSFQSKSLMTHLKQGLSYLGRHVQVMLWLKEQNKTIQDILTPGSNIQYDVKYPIQTNHLKHQAAPTWCRKPSFLGLVDGRTTC